MAKVITPSTLEAVFQQIDLSFKEGRDSATPWWSKVATKKSSVTRENHYPLKARTHKLREWNGPRQAESERVYDYVLKNRKFEETLDVNREDIEDDQLGIYADQARDLGYAASIWPDQLVREAMEAGASSIGHDGVNFFSTSHKINPEGSSTQANLFTSKPLTADNFNLVRSKMKLFKDEAGESFRVTPNLLVVPPSLEKKALEILNGELIGQVYGSNTAAAAPTNVLKGSCDILVVHDLLDAGDTSTWYLLDTSRPLKPFLFQERVAPSVTSLVNESDPNVFERDVYRYGIRARGAAGYGLWFLASRVEGTL